MQFLSNEGSTMIIDECRRVPKLFPALKLHIQKNQRPGQFLLTESVRFTARKAIQESLTGRIISLELLPLTIAEMCEIPLQDLKTYQFTQLQTLNIHYKKRIHHAPKDVLEKYLLRGGLPGFWFLREQSFLNLKFKSHIETLLQRDIKLIIETTLPYENLLELLRYISLHQGEPLNFSEAGKSSQISANTLKKIISAYENMFLIRRVTGMDYIKSPMFFLEDQGMASYLSGSTSFQDVLRFAFAQLFAQFHYKEMGVFSVNYYTTKGGAHVPFVFLVKGETYAFMVAPGGDVSSKILLSAESFLKNHPKAHVTILIKGTTLFSRMSTKILLAPLLALI